MLHFFRLEWLTISKGAFNLSLLKVHFGPFYAFYLMCSSLVMPVSVGDGKMIILNKDLVRMMPITVSVTWHVMVTPVRCVGVQEQTVYTSQVNVNNNSPFYTGTVMDAMELHFSPNIMARCPSWLSHSYPGVNQRSKIKSSTQVKICDRNVWYFH